MAWLVQESPPDSQHGGSSDEMEHLRPSRQRQMSILESLAQGMATLWPGQGEDEVGGYGAEDEPGLRGRDRDRSPSTSSAASSEPPEAPPAPPSLLGGVARGLRRLSGDLGLGLGALSLLGSGGAGDGAGGTGGGGHEGRGGGGAAEDPGGSHRGGGNESSSSSATTLDVGELLNEAHVPFRQLLVEVPDPDASAGVQGLLSAFPRLLRTESASALLSGHEGREGREDTGSSAAEAEGAGGAQGHDSRESRSPLFSAIVRARLIGHVVGCYEAVACDLSNDDEGRLWDEFVGLDEQLQAALHVYTEGLHAILAEMLSSAERADACVQALAERATDEGEVDFADLLDVYTHAKESEHSWSLRSSLRSSITALFGVAGGASPAPRSRPTRTGELRARCAAMRAVRLAAAAAAYQRSLVLTSSWRCERRLLLLLRPAAAAAANGDNGRGRMPPLLSALLSVLRGIHAELAPTERVLWELAGSRDHNFDGFLSKAEVLAAITELLQHNLAREAADTARAELEELERLRGDCQRRSVDVLFAGARRSVTLADLLRWWWDMPEDYRVAAGLSVPAELKRRSLKRQPEQMFQAHLRRCAAELPFARVSLRGHSRAFAELRALAVRRTVEGLSSRSPTETRTTTTSENGDFPFVSDVFDGSLVDPDEEDASPDTTTITGMAGSCVPTVAAVAAAAEAAEAAEAAAAAPAPPSAPSAAPAGPAV